MVKVGGREINDSIETIPIINYQNYYYYELASNLTGCEVNRLSQTLERLIAYKNLGDQESMRIEIENAAYGITFNKNGYFPFLLSIMCLEKNRDSFEREELQEIVNQIDVGELLDAKEKIHKNIQLQAEKTFPRYFNNYEGFEMDGLLQENNTFLKKYIENPSEENYNKMQQSNYQVTTSGKCLHYESTLIKQKKNFAYSCSELKGMGINNPESLTFFEFYATLEHLESKNKPKDLSASI